MLEKRAAFLDSKAEKLQAQVAELQHSPDPQGEGSAAVLRNKSQALEMQVLNERQRAELLAAQRAQADDAVGWCLLARTSSNENCSALGSQ